MMNKTVLPLIILSILFMGACTTKQSNEWSKWRGPNADGKITSENFNPEKLDSANILWNKDIGYGHSAISISKDKCYASGWKEVIEGGDTLHTSTIYCLNVDDGSEI